jgi:hypothetical protein
MKEKIKVALPVFFLVLSVILFLLVLFVPIAKSVACHDPTPEFSTSSSLMTESSATSTQGTRSLADWILGNEDWTFQFSWLFYSFVAAFFVSFAFSALSVFLNWGSTTSHLGKGAFLGSAVSTGVFVILFFSILILVLCKSAGPDVCFY